MKQALMAAIFAVSMTNAFSASDLLKDVTPTPGGAQILLDVTSFGALFQYAGALSPMYALVGKHIDIGLNLEQDHFQFQLNNATITSVNMLTNNISFVNGTDNIKITLPNCEIGLDLDGHVQASESILKLEADFQNVTLKNVTINVELGINAADNGVNWQLSIDPYLNIADVDLQMKQKLMTKELEKLKGPFMKVLRYGESFIQGAAKGAVDYLNLALANQNDDTFVVDLSGLIGMPVSLNLTMTRAPIFSAKDNTINIQFDALFPKDGMREAIAENKNFAEMTGQKQRMQVWLHESMLDSLIYNIALKIKQDSGLMQQLFQLVPEVFYHYGRNASCEGDVAMPYNQPHYPISVNKTQGIVVGDKTNGLLAEVKLYCANDTKSEKELALDMKLGIHAVANITWNNFEYWANITKVEAVYTNITSPTTKLDAHDFEHEFTYLLSDMANQFNLRFATPNDLKKIVLVNFVAGIIPDSVLTPFAADEFLLAGFRMITDPATPIAAKVNEALKGFLQ